MTHKAKDVAALRAKIDAEGLAEAMETLGEILADDDPSVIEPLLTMRAYPKGHQHHDEMWSIIHAVEAFPPDVYIPAIARKICKLWQDSPYLLDVLLIRMLNSDQYAAVLLHQVNGMDTERTRCLGDALAEVQREWVEEPNAKVNCRNILAALRR